MWMEQSAIDQRSWWFAPDGEKGNILRAQQGGFSVGKCVKEKKSEGRCPGLSWATRLIKSSFSKMRKLWKEVWGGQQEFGFWYAKFYNVLFSKTPFENCHFCLIFTSRRRLRTKIRKVIKWKLTHQMVKPHLSSLLWFWERWQPRFTYSLMPTFSPTLWDWYATLWGNWPAQEKNPCRYQ